MQFPVYIHIGSLAIHPHLLFESLAYFIGFRVYLLTRQKERIPYEKAIWVIVGATLGAALGSKLLYWFEQPAVTLQHLLDLHYLMEGKSIVGGLLGGLIGVELMKKKIGWTRSTGDDFVFPLLIGMCIGRIGCFLTGLSDHTYGTETTWITGVDFGDGVYRHPTQLYEIGYLLVLGGLLLYLKRTVTPKREGQWFEWFMIGYLLFRLSIDFIKPTPHPFFGLNNIQIACILGLIYYIYVKPKNHKKQSEVSYAK